MFDILVYLLSLVPSLLSGCGIPVDKLGSLPSLWVTINKKKYRFELAYKIGGKWSPFLPFDSFKSEISRVRPILWLLIRFDYYKTSAFFFNFFPLSILCSFRSLSLEFHLWHRWQRWLLIIFKFKLIIENILMHDMNHKVLM